MFRNLNRSDTPGAGRVPPWSSATLLLPILPCWWMGMPIAADCRLVGHQQKSFPSLAVSVLPFLLPCLSGRLDAEDRLIYFYFFFLSLWLFLEMASSSGLCILHPCRNQFVVWPLLTSHAFCQEVTKLPPDTQQSMFLSSLDWF